MPTLFTRIIDGDLPGRFIHRDDLCVVFLTIEPISPGHALVVPIVEVDHWIDLDADVAAHCFTVAQRVGQAIDHVWQPARIAVIIAGMEVPHTHLHVFGINSESQLSFAAVDRTPDPTALDEAAALLRAALDG